MTDERQAALAWEGERCQTCGQVYWPVTWHAPDELWYTIRPEGGLLCPTCFTKEAAARGIEVDWHVGRWSRDDTSTWHIGPNGERI